MTVSCHYLWVLYPHTNVHASAWTHTHMNTRKYHPLPSCIFLIVAMQRLEKVNAAPLDIDLVIVIMSSFPFLSSRFNNTQTLSLKASSHLPHDVHGHHVGGVWVLNIQKTHKHTDTHTKSCKHAKTQVKNWALSWNRATKTGMHIHISTRMHASHSLGSKWMSPPIFSKVIWKGSQRQGSC